MKSADRVKKMRDTSNDELRNQQADLKEQMFRLRFQWQMGQTETLAKLRQLRKDRARMLTILSEKQASGETVPAAAAPAKAKAERQWNSVGSPTRCGTTGRAYSRRD